jgi:hypothetical protein
MIMVELCNIPNNSIKDTLWQEYFLPISLLIYLKFKIFLSKRLRASYMFFEWLDVFIKKKFIIKFIISNYELG